MFEDQGKSFVARNCRISDFLCVCVCVCEYSNWCLNIVITIFIWWVYSFVWNLVSTHDNLQLEITLNLLFRIQNMYSISQHSILQDMYVYIYAVFIFKRHMPQLLQPQVVVFLRLLISLTDGASTDINIFYIWLHFGLGLFLCAVGSNSWLAPRCSVKLWIGSQGRFLAEALWMLLSVAPLRLQGLLLPLSNTRSLFYAGDRGWWIPESPRTQRSEAVIIFALRDAGKRQKSRSGQTIGHRNGRMRSSYVACSTRPTGITKSLLFPGNCCAYFWINLDSYRLMMYRAGQKLVIWLVKYIIEYVGISFINYRIFKHFSKWDPRSLLWVNASCCVVTMNKYNNSMFSA
jgi:hypothetical protein